MKKIFFSLLYVLALASCSNTQTKKSAELPIEEPMEDVTAIRHLSYKEFLDKICDFEQATGWEYKGSKPVIIDFYAEWCQPCKKLSPILEELKDEYNGKIDFYKIDIDKEPELATACSVKSIPVLLFVPTEGKEPRPHVGLAEKEELQQVIKEVFGF